MNNEDRRGVCFYRGRMPRVFWCRAPGRQGGGAKSRAGLFERRGFPQRQVAYSQTIDDVYWEDFPFRGRDSIFQHETPSRLSSPIIE